MIPRAAIALVAGLFALSLVVLAAGGTNPLLAALPVVVLLLATFAAAAPVRIVSLSLFFLTLVADAPQDNPMSGLWRSPLYGLGEILTDNWSKTFGIGLLGFSGIDVLVAVLLCRVLVAQMARSKLSPLATPLRRAGAVFLLAMVALFAFGALRGGNAAAAYWQVRQLAFIPLLVIVLGEAASSTGHALGKALLAAAVVKAFVGFFFRAFVPEAADAPVMTSHADTLLFCMATVAVLVRFLEDPYPTVRGSLYVAVMLAAIVLNNRRLAWVELGFAFFVVAVVSRRGPVRRALRRMALVAVPVALLYVGIGWASTLPFFKPVTSIRTIVAADQVEHGASESTRSRDIENWNLAQTLRNHPLGIGLGHGYDEVVKGPDISESFQLYRYIPHNSMLWLVAMSGPIGFFLLWSLFVTGIYLAIRGHQAAATADERVAAVCAVCGQLLFLVQAFGDMGTQSWTTTFIVSAALAVSGRLAAIHVFAPRAQLVQERFT